MSIFYIPTHEKQSVGTFKNKNIVKSQRTNTTYLFKYAYLKNC